jgi:phosphopantetheinyl transferase
VLCVSPVRNRTAEGRTRDPGATELAREFFSAAEARVVEGHDGLAKLQTFFQFWSLKEAALKSIGEGLPYGLDALEFDSNLRVIQAPPDHGGPGQFSAHVIAGTDHCAAMVIRSGLN